MLAIFRAILLILEAIKDPDSVQMSIETVDGRWTTLPCKVVRTGATRAKITANYNSMGVPISRAVITIGGKPYARAHMTEGSVRYTAGPVELGGDF